MVSHPLSETAFTSHEVGKTLALALAQSSREQGGRLWIFMSEDSGICVLSIKTPSLSKDSGLIMFS